MSSLTQNSPFSNFVVKETATLNWTIDGFNQVEEVRSPRFSSLNSSKTFRLLLNATNRLFNVNRIFFELWYNQHKKEVSLCYHISILDANGTKHYTKEYIWKCQEPNHGLCEFNVTSYISRNKCKEFLVNGCLNICCEVDVLGEKSNKFKHQQINEPIVKLSADLEKLLETGKLSDFNVQIGEKQFNIHKNILAARSAVFASMFEHEEAKEVKEGRVVIEDVQVDVFELLIRYIYTGKVDTLDEHADELLVAADKYQLDHLKSICEQSLISTLTAESVCALLVIADMHNAEQLKLKCIEYVVEHAEEVMLTAGWKELAATKRIDLVMELFAKLAYKDN